MRILPSWYLKKQQEAIDRAGDGSQSVDYLVYYHLYSGKYGATFGFKESCSVWLVGSSGYNVQLMCRFIGEHERSTYQVSYMMIEVIMLWFHLGIFLLRVGINHLSLRVYAI